MNWQRLYFEWECCGREFEAGREGGKNAPGDREQRDLKGAAERPHAERGLWAWRCRPLAGGRGSAFPSPRASGTSYITWPGQGELDFHS